MVLLLWILLAIMPFLLGSGIVRCLYGSRYKDSNTLGEIFLAGLCVLIGTAEVTHLAGVFLKWSVSRMALLWGGILAVLAVGSLIVLLIGQKGKKEADGIRQDAGAVKTRQQLLAGVLALSVLLQIIMIMTGDMSCNTGDMTLETVRTFVAQDQLFQMNPLTGQPYTAGVPLRLKILCLPSLYASICSLTGLDAELVVYRMIPAAVLLGSYLAYNILGKVLFRQDRTGRLLMLLLISVLYWCGDYMDSMDGFLLLHCGYRGISIRNGILIPFTLGMCLQKKWRLAILAILAEACILWTLYGLGACLLVAVILLLISLWIHIRERRGGKACRNS